MQINANSMMAHQTLMNINANNIANVNSKDFKADEANIVSNLNVSVNSTNKPTDITKELTNQIPITKGFEAQIPVIKTENEMMGTLLDMKV
jgi:flagellar hook protein FlgE